MTPVERRVAWAMVALLGLAGACGQPAPERVIDLLELFPFTEAGQTVNLIDLGSPEADGLLRSGWSPPETLPDGTTVAWALARRVAVQLAIGAPSDGRLVLRAGLAGEGAPVSALLRISCNGRRVGMVRVGRTLVERTLALPARYQRSGMNVVEIANALLTVLPRRRSASRNRAVAIDWLRFDGVNGGARPTVKREHGMARALALPARTRTDFFVQVPEDGLLAADLAPTSSGRSGLRVSFTVDGAPEQILSDGAAPAGSLRLPLPAPAGTLARVSFRPDQAIEISHPEILGHVRPSAPPAAVATASPPRANVVLYLIDTLRADHVGCYGYPQATTPHLDALAKQGIVFEDMLAQASWTLPASASIMTGVDPLFHGAVSLATPIRRETTMLAEVLKAHGYQTAAFVTNVNVRGDLGFRRGFDQFEYLPEDVTSPTVHVPAREAVRRATAWLDAHHGAPFLLYVHATDPHAPYRPPPCAAAAVRPPGEPPPIAAEPDPLHALARNESLRTPENVAWVRSLYDGDIRVADDALGDLVGALRALDVDDRTLIVVVGDHGEEFLDHGGFEHGRTLYRELLRVPLVVRRPGGRDGGRRVTALARQLDVLPTVLAEVGISPPQGVQGRNLLSAAPPADGAQLCLSHSSLGPFETFGLNTPRYAVVQAIGRQRDRFEVYDLARDPVERHNVAREQPVVAGWGHEVLARFATRVPRLAPGAEHREEILDPETARRLKALGYVAQ